MTEYNLTQVQRNILMDALNRYEYDLLHTDGVEVPEGVAGDLRAARLASELANAVYDAKDVKMDIGTEGYTVWVWAGSYAQGTHHVSYHTGTLEQVKAAAIEEAIGDWDYEDHKESLCVLGVVEGDVTLVEWDEMA